MILVLFKKAPSNPQSEVPDALWITDTACILQDASHPDLLAINLGSDRVAVIDLRHPDGGAYGAVSSDQEKAIRAYIATNYRESEEAMNDRRD